MCFTNFKLILAQLIHNFAYKDIKLHKRIYKISLKKKHIAQVSL